MPKSKRAFRVDARALISLGRESIKDHTTALIELVKNSYDADAENVEIEIIGADRSSGSYIRIADDGSGMSSQDIDGKFLRIGFSEKRKKKFSRKGRRETGEKGIGRLSADRLGAILELRSQTEGYAEVGVRVDWNQFDIDGTEIGAVAVEDLEDSRPVLCLRANPKQLPKTGTEVRIKELRQGWNSDDLDYLGVELATLVPASRAKGDFQIWIRTSVADEFESVRSAFELAAALELEGEFDKSGRLSYRVSTPPLKAGQNRHSIRTGDVAWNQLVNSNPQIPFSTGKFSVLLSFFPRKAASLSGNFSLNQLKEYLDAQGGVRIYRDGIKVKPYGDPTHPEGDWLSLSERKIRNPAGAGRKSFKIAANQLVGVIEIGRDTNPGLSDSAAREGLIHSAEFVTLKVAVIACVQLLESFYHERFSSEREAEQESAERLPEVLGQIKEGLGTLKRSLSDVQRSAEGRESVRLRATVEQLAAVSERFARAEREIEELASQATVYRGLATVGISSAVFAHETESALAQARMSTSLALKSISASKPNLSLTQTELEKATKAITKVGVWGQFAISRVKKDKRRRTKVDVSKIIGNLADEIEPLYQAAGLKLERKIVHGLEIRAFVMDIEAVILNLLTNAFHHAGMSKAKRVLLTAAYAGKGDDRVIELSVSDSGPGIAREHLPQIWTPLFSTKADTKGRSVGTGLGLSIVKSVADEMNGSVLAQPKGELGGATFKIRFPAKRN
ncbi:ATP-binding protein [Arenimonas sp.]|uniref:sensor histidine kinase n=1 Tax=Arenimonas sp. TaxID=1872635 RepID=UPI0039E5BA31